MFRLNVEVHSHWICGTKVALITPIVDLSMHELLVSLQITLTSELFITICTIQLLVSLQSILLLS